MIIEKELLTVEFRYNDAPSGEYDGGSRSKTVTIGLFDTLDEAIIEGNKIISLILAKHFKVRGNDKFKKHGLVGGQPCRLISNCFYSNGIQYFAKIEKLCFSDIELTILEAKQALKRRKAYREDMGEW